MLASYFSEYFVLFFYNVHLLFFTLYFSQFADIGMFQSDQRLKKC